MYKSPLGASSSAVGLKNNYYQWFLGIIHTLQIIKNMSNPAQNFSHKTFKAGGLLATLLFSISFFVPNKKNKKKGVNDTKEFNW